MRRYSCAGMIAALAAAFGGSVAVHSAPLEARDARRVRAIERQEAPASVQEPDPDRRLEELTRQVEKLMKRVGELEAERAKTLRENEELRTEVEQLRKLSLETSQSLLRLRQVLAELESRGSTSNSGAPAPGPGTPAARPADPSGPTEPPKGPAQPLRAKVMAKSPEDLGFVIIDKGEPDGVKEGWTFDIIRKVRNPDGSERLESLGEAVFEKYVLNQPGQSKLKVTKGDLAKIEYGDIAVARRQMEPSGRVGSTPPNNPASSARDKTLRIAGLHRDTYFLNYGSEHGAKPGDKVYVVRERRVIAHLRLDTVEREYSSAKLIEGTKAADPAIDDEILTKELKSQLIGRVKRADDKLGLVLDVSEMQGAKPGMIFDVRRQGRSVGKVILRTVNKLYSVADPHGDTKREDIQEGDLVESVE